MMKINLRSHFVIASLISATISVAQSTVLRPGNTVERQLLKGENHIYVFNLKKGEFAECTINQKDVDIVIDLTDGSGAKMGTFDSPNGKIGPESVFIKALSNGTYRFNIYPLPERTGMTDSVKALWVEENQGAYSITNIAKLSASQYNERLALDNKEDENFARWIKINAHELKTVDPNAGLEDLQQFKSILKDVRVVGMGESSHGTSEFFRMKHRMLEFLVKEMGFTSFYIEASMTRCRYINDYVLYGKGNLDTATVIQGFTTWRVHEVRNMIEWMRQYNASAPQESKIKFLGFDLQINDRGWKDLKVFYKKVNPVKFNLLESLQIQLDTAAHWSNSMNRQLEGAALFKTLFQKCLLVMSDMVLNEGQYAYIAGKERYEENLMNIRLIVQEVESYQDGYNDRRDYYMAQNILHLLNLEKPGAKVAVWAHNGHVAKYEGTMGAFLDTVLKQSYYAIGFEFYSGSFQSKNIDTTNNSRNWDIVTIGAPPEKSLPWYFNDTGMDKLFIDFRNTGTENVRNFPRRYNMHSFGSMYSKQWKEMYPETLQIFDGMIYIKTSTAAKNFIIEN